MALLGNAEDKFGVGLNGKLVFNQGLNRIYDKKHTYWDGTLNDNRDRGGKPYYCPVGWKRYALNVANSNDEFYKKFKGWAIAYHGTRFQYGLSILLSGLRYAEINVHGKGVYFSPSIIYCANPRYSEIKEIPSEYRSQFTSKGNGKYVQFILECRVRVDQIVKIDRETLNIPKDTIIDRNFKNNEIEWLVDNNSPNDFIKFSDHNTCVVCTGIMMRVTDKHPELLDDSRWWHHGKQQSCSEHCEIINE